MSERKTWTTEEDQILRQLYERRSIKKWSRISELMETNYHISGRSGKQCRQRYHNHLKGGIKKERWSIEEEEKLVELHTKHGNKWALISKLIPGRTQNCVKNMFNSKLRKSVRLLNRFIYLYYRKALKQIKVSFINRLSQFTEAAHKKAQEERSPQENAAIQIKNEILMQGDYQVHELSQPEIIKIKGLIQQIHAFKKENHKHYRANVLARLRKQKSRKRSTEDKQIMQVEEQQPGILKQPADEEDVEPVKKSKLKQKNKKVQSNIARQEDFLELIKETSENHQDPFQNREAQPFDGLRMKKRGSIQRLQSLESNYSGILGNQGLEKPIQVENYMHNITPTPKYNQVDLLDWNLSVIDWRFDAD